MNSRLRNIYVMIFILPWKFGLLLFNVKRDERVANVKAFLININ